MQNLLLYISLLISSASTDSTVIPGAQKITDVAYGSHTRQKMDIYLPAGRDTVNTPLMILIHGGGWSGGDKADLEPYIEALQKLFPRYAFANINYRLYRNGNNTFPSQENDVKAAVSFLTGKAGEYEFSQKVVLLGASAGAHLALLQGYKHTDVVRPQAIISFFGPADLVALYERPGFAGLPSLLAGITGYTPQQNLRVYENASPVNFVSRQSPPTLILQGGNDMLVPPAQAQLLKAALAGAGVAHKLVYYPAEGHGWKGATLEDSFQKIRKFLQENVE